MSRPTDAAVTPRPDAWWIPVAFLLPPFITAAAVARIEAACNAWADEEEQVTA